MISPIDDAELLFESARWRGAVEDGFDLTIREWRSEDGTERAWYSILDDVRGRRVVSIPFSDFADPHIDRAASWTEFRDELMCHDAPVVLRPFRNELALSDQVFDRSEGEVVWHGIDLREGFDEWFATRTTAFRTKVRRTERDGTTIRVSSCWADLEVFHSLHVDLRRTKFGMLAQPLDFFRSLHERFGDDLVVVSAHRDGVCVAGAVFLTHGSQTYYKFSASLNVPKRPATGLLAAGCRHAVEVGSASMDLGRSDTDQPGLLHFKRAFATEERPLVSLHWNPSASIDPHAAAGGRLLGELTRLFTREGVPHDVAADAGALLYRNFG